MSEVPPPEQKMSIDDFVSAFKAARESDNARWDTYENRALRCNQDCPLTFMANRLRPHLRHLRDSEFNVAGARLRLSLGDTYDIAYAADATLKHSPKLRARLLEAAGVR